jgi:molybdenum cofactor synthesis domain-containing protein
MKEINTVDAVGHVLCHDITQIIKDQVKQARFRKGHIVTQEDIPVLLSLGKDHLFVWEKNENILHENEAAEILAALCKNDAIKLTSVSEGKISMISEIDGLFVVDAVRLNAINALDEIMIATLPTYYPVKKGDKLAGTRVIPLVIEKAKLQIAVKVGGKTPIMEVRPYKQLKTGLITTGNEVFHHRIDDTFSPVVIAKLKQYGIEVYSHVIIGDDKEAITSSILKMKSEGADLILCTGGMSVDADDRTPGAIKDTGAAIVSYGAPVLPGAMFLLAYFDNGTTVMGLPGCVMYAKTTIFDLILPRVVSGLKVSEKSLDQLGMGGLCQECAVCHWPNCGFGKGV